MDVADQNFATFQVKDVVGERCQKLFQDFLEEFTVKGEIKYVAQALQLVRPEKNTLTVSYADLQKHNHQLATTIQQKYYRVYPYICRAVRNFAIDRVQVPAAKEFYVSFTNSSASVKIRALDNMAKIGTLVKVTGQVVRTHPVHPELVSGSFVCLECQTTIKDVEQQFKYTQPTICRNPVCKNRSRFLLDVNKSKFVDSQKIRIQEAQVELPRGSIPRSMEVILRAEAVESVQAGDQCEFTGTLIVVPDIDSLSMPGVCVECGTRLQGGGGQNVEGLGGLKALGVRDHSYKMAFLACTVERTNRKCGGLDPGKDDASPELRKMQMTEVEWQKVYRMSQDKSLCHNLCQSLFPTIHGNDEVKRGILLMLFGGVPKVTLEGTHLRGDINVCIVGDPSTGKSQLLKQVEKFSPWAVYTSGKASTAAGLTAAIVRDEESHEFVIEAGALMLADNGVCCIDDFDKMDPKDQLAIHEAMDQQTISITKAGVKATLNARTSILAAANPISGGYDRSKSLEQNIAMTTPIMSRFDLFFLLVDKCNEVTDNAIIRNIIERHSHHGSSVRGTYSADDIQRYITFARQLKPKISRDSAELIVKEYKRLRQRDTSGATKSAWRITVRHLESLIRLSEAMGRMYCQKEVQPKHVKEAFRLLEKSVIRVKQLEEGEPEEPLVEVEGFRLNAPQASAPVSNPGFFGAKPAAPVPGFGNPSNATAPAGSSPFTFTGQQPAAPPAPGVQKLNATYDAAVTRPSPVHINVVVFGQPAAVTAPRLLNSGAGSNTQSKPAGVPTLSAKPSDAASKPDVMPSLSQRGSKRSMDDDGVGSMRGRSGSAKDRTNIGMREQFTLVEGVSQSTAHSKTRVVGGQHRDGSQASRAPSAIGHTSSSATGTIGKKSGASISSHPHQKSKVSSDVKVGQILSKPGLPAKVKTQGHTHDRGSSCLEVFRQPAAVTAPRLLNFGAGSNTQSKPAGVPTLSAKPSDAASKPDVMPSLSQRGSKRSMDDDGVGSMRGRSGSAKDRTNIGMREQFTLVEGVSQSTAHSKTRVVGGQHRDGSQASRAPSAIGHTSSSATGTIGKKSGASISSRPHQKSKVSSDVKVGEILSKPGLPEKVKTQGHTYDRGSPCLEGLGTPERVYPTRSELEKEVQTNVQCPVDGCVKIFRHPSALQMHLVKLHRQIVTESDARLAKRLKPEAKKPCKFYCPESGCRFNGHQHLNSSKSLREHFLRLHAPRKLGCSICGKKYGLSQDLKRHKTQCHLKPWCLSCHVRMGSWTILAQHLRLTGHKGLDGQCFEDVNGAEMPDQHGMRGTTSQKACSDRTAVSQVSTTVRKGKSADQKKRSQDTRPRKIPPAPPNYMCGGYHATFGHSTAVAGDQHLASSAVSLSSISRPPLSSVVDRASAVPCSKMQPSTSRGSSGPSSASCSSLTKRSAPMPSGGYSSSDASKAIYPGKVVDQPVVTPSKKRCIERKNTCEPGDGPQIQGTFFGCG